MSERFQKLYTIKPNLYSEGCPVIIKAGALHKDIESGAIIAQVKMLNIGEKSITSCKVSVRAYENNGDEVEGVKVFSYLDINVGIGSEFGSKVPIFIPDRTARSFSVDIREIVFTDGTVQRFDNSEWKTLPIQTTIQEYFHNNNELIEQYDEETKGSGKFLPEKKNGLFLCTCGAVNLDSSEKCYVCGNSYDMLRQYLDIDYLSIKIQTKKASEEQRAQISRKRQEKNKQNLIAALQIMVPVLNAIALIITLIAQPTFAYGNYNAMTLLEELSYHGKKVYSGDQPYPGGVTIGFAIILAFLLVITAYVMTLRRKRPYWLNDTILAILPALPLLLIVIMVAIGSTPRVFKNTYNWVLVIYSLGYVIIALSIVSLITSLAQFIYKKNSKRS